MVIKYEIAMATFNGQEHLDEQIVSLLSQTIKPHRIVIFDDNSSDKTRQILDYWQNVSPISIKLMQHSSSNYGCVNAFERALLMTRESYIMLSDQDDIWDSNKAEVMLDRLLDAEDHYGKSTPLLVYSDLRLIDSNNNPLSLSFFRTQSLNPFRNQWLEIGLQNVVVGCASAFNRASLDCALPFSRNTLVHDWWLALETSRAGKLIYIDTQTVSYRQHEKNLIGARGLSYHLALKIYSRIKSYFGFYCGNSLPASVEDGITQFLTSYSKDIYQIQAFPELNSLLSSNFFERLLVALKLRLSKHGAIRTILWYLSLISIKPELKNEHR